MRRSTIRLAGMILLVLAFALAPVGAGAAGRGQRTDPRQVRATGVRVKIVDFAFRPKTISVAKGTRVTWVNRDAAAHTSTSKTGLWDSGSLAQGESFSRVFRKAGTFKYRCTIHPTMVGKIVVG